jgi:hypothetical protein
VPSIALHDMVHNIGMTGGLTEEVDMRGGLSAEYLAWCKGRTQSIAQEEHIGKGRDIDKGVLEPIRGVLSYEEKYDLRQEALGWYRTARVAEILHIDPRWMMFVVECGIIKSAHSYGTGAEAKRVRVRLAEVREWQATR